MKIKDWIKKAKARCKYLAVALILLGLFVPITFSRQDEADATTENEPTTPPPSAVPQNPANTTAKGFKGVGETSVHAETVILNPRNFRNTLSGTRLDIKVDQPFPQGSNGFANGTSCVFATVEVISQGGFLQNEPLIIEKPDSITINGPTDTSGGSFRWCITSTQPIQASITVKLANFPQTQETFQVNFLPTLTISNMTKSSNFIFDRPITFLAQIAPWMVQGLKVAKVTYNTVRCGCGTNACENIVAEQNLDCSFNGICSATIPASLTAVNVNSTTQSQPFNYTFSFEDTNGNKFQQANSGSLRFP